MKTRSFALNRVFITAVLSVMVAVVAKRWLYPQPRYDLLFSIDYNGIPYSDPESPGLVFRVNNHKAIAFYTNKLEPVIGFSLPSLYICDAETGTLHEIPITPPTLPSPADTPYVDTPFVDKPFLAARPIHVPELELLTLDTSSKAPDGYALRGFNVLYGAGLAPVEIRFDRTYAHPMLTDSFWPLEQIRVDGGDNSKMLVQLEDSGYKHCLERIGGHNTALTTHFIGWVRPP